MNPVTPSAMKSVQILRVTIRSASAKVRAKNMGLADSLDIVTTRDDIYTGVIPLYDVLGEPVESGYTPNRPIQRHLHQWMKERNVHEKNYAFKAAKNTSEDEEKIKEQIKEIEKMTSR